MPKLKASLNLWMLFAFSFGCASAQAVEFDTSHIKLEIILDNKVLRFPEPVFGLVRITNTSDKEEFFPASLFAITSHDLDTVNIILNPVLTNPATLIKVKAGYCETRAFRYSVGDKKQMRAILVDKSPLTFTFRTYGKPNKFPIENPRQPEYIENDEAKGFEDIDSPPVTVHYSLEHLVFRERINKKFALRTLDLSSWPQENPFRLSVSNFFKYRDNPRNEYSVEFDESVALDGILFDQIPIVRPFAQQLWHLQSLVRCDTVTWRFLEVERIRQFSLSRPKSPETRLRAGEDFVNVIKCMGRAEAYYHGGSAPDPSHYRNDEIVINGKTRNLDEYMDERMFIDEVPGLYVRVDNPDFKEAGSGAPGNEDQSYVRRYIWKSLINDTTLPSPREASIKRWIDGGKQGPNPCPCWNEEEDAKVKIPVPVPDESEKD